MSLTTIVRRYGGKSRKVYTGWKVFTFDNLQQRHLLGRIFRTKGNGRLPVGQWLSCEDYFPVLNTPCGQVRIKTEVKLPKKYRYYLPDSYTAGWHVYTTKPELPKTSYFIYNTVREVKYRKVTILGGDDGTPVVVAREIYIVPRRRQTG